MRERLSFGSVVMILAMMVITSSCIREREDSDIPRRAVMNTPKEKSEHRLLTLNSGALVEVLPSGEYVYQGDMILSRKQIELLDKTVLFMEMLMLRILLTAVCLCIHRRGWLHIRLIVGSKHSVEIQGRACFGLWLGIRFILL